MERRHQVFISSTFSDLIEERSEIIQALLELDCIPAGMEMFPATNDAAWELIKGVIDDSDYYCLVIGGRYGSTDKSGISFTEKEYDYALSVGKPLIAFLHKDSSQIKLGKAEQTPDGREKLAAFRKKVEDAHHCKYWMSAEELGGQVSRSLISLRKTYPSEGWVPGSYAADEELRIENANLRARVAELESELAKREAKSEAAIPDHLSSGNDTFAPQISYTGADKMRKWASVTVTWDQILRYAGPSLLGECSEDELWERVNLCFYHALQRQVPSDKPEYSSVVVPHITNDQIKVQLRALGQMIPGTKRRTVSDKRNYWKLSQSGEARLLSIQALSRPQTTAQLPLEGTAEESPTTADSTRKS